METPDGRCGVDWPDRRGVLATRAVNRGSWLFGQRSTTSGTPSPSVSTVLLPGVVPVLLATGVVAGRRNADDDGGHVVCEQAGNIVVVKNVGAV